MTTPLICGTLVRDQSEYEKVGGQNRINNLTFNRKLRMMRADVFALLSISTNSDFIADPADSQVIKTAVLKFLEGEFNEKAAQYQVFSRLKGWNKLLHEKCNANQILQIHSINQPECVSSAIAQHEAAEDGCPHYAFATFLEPGYH